MKFLKCIKQIVPNKLFKSSLVITAALFAATFSVYGATSYTITGTGDNRTLTITGTGDMPNYNYGGTPWYSQYANIKTLIIEYGVTSIGNDAFVACSGLTSVTIPNSVQSIGYEAFTNCRGLTSVTIPNSVQTIGNSAFYLCSGLTSVTIPNSVQTIGNNAFSYCNGLTSVTIGNSVQTIGNSAFYGCSRLTSVTIPNSVQTIGNSAFMLCNGLTSVTIGNSVQSIGSSAFSECSGLTSVTIPNSVQSIGNSAFMLCSGLTSISVSGTNFKLADNVGSAQVLIPYADAGLNASCSNVVGCLAIGALTIPNSVTAIGNSAFMLCSGLTSVTIPNSVQTIGEDAFGNCRGLTSITIPNSVQTIGNSAFAYCYSLQTLTVNWATPSSVTLGSDVFAFVNVFDVRLIVPYGTSALYSEADVWKDFIIEQASGINEVRNNELQIIIDNGKLIIENYAGGAVQVFDALGRVVLSTPPSLVSPPSQMSLNIAHLPTSVYIVKAGNKTGKFVKK